CAHGSSLSQNITKMERETGMGGNLGTDLKSDEALKEEGLSSNFEKSEALNRTHDFLHYSFHGIRDPVTFDERNQIFHLKKCGDFLIGNTNIKTFFYIADQFQRAQRVEAQVLHEIAVLLHARRRDIQFLDDKRDDLVFNGSHTESSFLEVEMRFGY